MKATLVSTLQRRPLRPGACDGRLSLPRGFSPAICYTILYIVYNTTYIIYVGNNFDLLKMRKNLKLIFGS